MEVGQLRETDRGRAHEAGGSAAPGRSTAAGHATALHGQSLRGCKEEDKGGAGTGEARQGDADWHGDATGDGEWPWMATAWNAYTAVY